MLDSGGSLRFSWKDGGLFLLIFACWLADSLQQMIKYFHGLIGIGVLAGACSIAVVLFAVRWVQSRHDGKIHWAWFAAFWIVMVILYAVLYPIAQRHVFGVGSDREDGLRNASLQLLHFHFPYYVRSYLGNLISPLPGALILAAPFALLGRVSLQNFVWLGAFIFFCVKFFRLRCTALAYLVVIVLAGAGALNDFVDGGDFVLNLFYICVTVFAFLRTFEENNVGWRHILAGILLGIALSSRTVFVVVLPLILAYLAQHGKGTKSALRSFALPILVAAAVTVPIYLYDPRNFTPLHVATKLNAVPIPPEFRSFLLILLPTLALIVASLGFFLQLTMPRLFLLAGLASAVILFTPSLIMMVQNPFSSQCLGLINYSETASMLTALWAFYRFEGASHDASTVRI
jgi:hypothetical protein